MAISFPTGTGQKVTSRASGKTKYRRLITGINERVATEVKIFFPRGSDEKTATGIWESGPVMVAGGPLYEFELKCTKPPIRLAHSLLDVTIEVINDGQSTSTNETIEIEIVTAP